MPSTNQQGSKLPGIILRIIDLAEVLDIEPIGEIILGRGSSFAAPEMTGDHDLGRLEIDLSSFMAYESGVSRRHALIKIIDERITITDLESANGTRLNGQDILANSPSNLHDGDILTLGKLKIQFMINPSA